VIVVADTTPLNYLVLVGAVEILPKLFEAVYAPREVLRELIEPGAPELVRAWAQHGPDWLVVLAPSARLPSTARLDPGEADAISLAKEIKAPAVLLDEKKGRSIAVAEGLAVIRTLALLKLAAERNLIDLPSTLDQLRRTSFRIRQEVIDAALARNAARKGARPES
jgi:predicted nucleic acid-binding protein